MTDPDLRLFIQTVLEGFIAPPIRNGKFCVRKKSATSRPSIRKFPPALSRCKNAMSIRWKTVSAFARRNGRASLPRWMGKALHPKICGFLPMRWTNLWGRIPCALKYTAARLGKPKSILLLARCIVLLARCIAVSVLPLNIARSAAPSSKSFPLSGKCVHGRIGATSLFFRQPENPKSSLHPTP